MGPRAGAFGLEAGAPCAAAPALGPELSVLRATDEAREPAPALPPALMMSLNTSTTTSHAPAKKSRGRERAVLPPRMKKPAATGSKSRAQKVQGPAGRARRPGSGCAQASRQHFQTNGGALPGRRYAPGQKENRKGEPAKRREHSTGLFNKA